MFTNLASGTNHDTLATLFGCLSVYYWARFLFHGKYADALGAAFCLSVGAATKMTLLVMAAPMVAIMIFELSGNFFERFKYSLGLITLAFILPGFWMIRHYLAFGNPFANFHNTLDPLFDNQHTQESFVAYLTNHPIFEDFFIHFYGLFGWFGTGMGQPWMIQISGIPLTFYSLISAVILSVVTFKYFSNYSYSGVNVAKHNHRQRNLISLLHKNIEIFGLFKGMNFSLFVLSIAMATLTFEHISTAEDAGGYGRKLTFVLVVFLITQSLAVFIAPKEKKLRITQYSLVTIGFYSCVLLWQLFELFQGYGAVRAIHGRYLYPLISLLFISFLVPILKGAKTKSWVLLLLALILGVLEVQTYSQQVLPFYNKEFLPKIVAPPKFVDHTIIGEIVTDTQIEQAFDVSDEASRRANIAGANRAVCVSVWLATYGRETNEGFLDLELRKGKKAERLKINISGVRDNSFQEPSCFSSFKASQFSPGTYHLTLRGAFAEAGSSVTTLLTSDTSLGSAVVDGEKTLQSMFFYVSLEPQVSRVFTFPNFMITILDFLAFTIILLAFLSADKPTKSVE
jgi:hypothetical protein